MRFDELGLIHFLQFSATSANRNCTLSKLKKNTFYLPRYCNPPLHCSLSLRLSPFLWMCTGRPPATISQQNDSLLQPTRGGSVNVWAALTEWVGTLVKVSFVSLCLRLAFRAETQGADLLLLLHMEKWRLILATWFRVYVKLDE